MPRARGTLFGGKSPLGPTLLAALLALWPLALGAQPRSPEALSLVSAAASRAGLGDWAGAEDLVDRVLALDNRDSDALYLSALAAMRLRDEVRPSLEALELARASDTFRIYTSQAARNLQAGLLVRLRRFDSVLRLLPGPGSGQTSADILDPEYRRLRALALLGLGQTRLALGELEAGAQRFPEDPGFARIFFQAWAHRAASEEALGLARVFLARLPSLSTADPDLPVLGLPFILDPGKRRDVILARRALGSFPVSASLGALQYGIISDKAAIAEVFGSSSSLGYADLEALRSLLGSAEGRKEFAARLAGFSGSIVFDRDGDGWPEEEALYRSARLGAWTLDADQDGRVEARLGFADGLPSDLRVDLGDIEARYHYGSYPSVLGLSLLPLSPGLGVTETYSFGPGSLLYAPIALGPYPSTAEPSIFLPVPSSLAPTSSRAATVLALGLRRVQGREGDYLSLDRGIPLRRESFLEGRLVALLDYTGGKPGVEKADTDLDGRFETERAYLPDSPAGPQDVLWSRVDSDGDGLFEYREERGPPPRKTWDLNQDGKPDAVELSLPEGQVRREFSSRLDGRLDEVLLLDAQGRIAGLTRDSRPIALVQDSNPRLRWLGRKPFDLGSNLPVSEGIYYHMGMRYRLVFAGTSAFAELIE